MQQAGRSTQACRAGTRRRLRQQLGWQEKVGTQHAGRHTGRQRRDTEEEGLQLTEEQGLGWQHKEAEQGEDSQQTGLQQRGVHRQVCSRRACSRQVCNRRVCESRRACSRRAHSRPAGRGREVQQVGWQLDCWQHEAGQELLQAGWQQRLDSQLTGAQRRVRRGPEHSSWGHSRGLAAAFWTVIHPPGGPSAGVTGPGQADPAAVAQVA